MRGERVEQGLARCRRRRRLDLLAEVPMPLSTSAPNANGAITPATLLQMPMKAMRCAALSIGPRMLMYGLEAVCSSDKPAPITNSPANAPGTCAC